MYIKSNAAEFNQSIKSYLTSLLSVSVACTILSILLYLLNISKFKNVAERIKFPLKINRAVFVFNMFIAGLIWQLLIIIEIHNYSYFKSNKIEHTVILYSMYISSIILYSWYFILTLLLFLTAYYVHASMFKDKMKILKSYIFVIFIVTVLLVLNILITYFQKVGHSFVEKFTNSKMSYWIINCIQIFTAIYGAIFIFYVIYVRAKQLYKANKSRKEIFYLLLTADYVRDKIIIFLILLLIMVTDLMYVVDAVSSNSYYYIYGMFHSFLVSNNFFKSDCPFYLNCICAIFETSNFFRFKKFLNGSRTTRSIGVSESWSCNKLNMEEIVYRRSCSVRSVGVLVYCHFIWLKNV